MAGDSDLIAALQREKGSNDIYALLETIITNTTGLMSLYQHQQERKGQFLSSVSISEAVLADAITAENAWYAANPAKRIIFREMYHDGLTHIITLTYSVYE